MDKWFFAAVLVSVLVASVIHGFIIGVRNGNRIQAVKVVGMENGTGANSSTLEFMILRTGPDPAVIAAMNVCVEALKVSTEQVEAATAAFQSCDAAAQGEAFDDLRTQMSSALEISRTCLKDCFVELSPDASEAAHQLHSACTSQMLSHSQVWMDAEELCWQYLDLEFNRIQLTESWWIHSSNSSDFSEL